jgi:MFS family permease
MHIINPTHQDIIVSTFLLPFSVSAFINGWFCDKFGSKIVGLTSIIISIPTLIWIGVPNQNIQSIAAALTMSGVALGGMSISTFVSTTRAIQKIQLDDQHDLTKPQQHALQREQATLIFSVICTLFGIGFFSSYFAAKLSEVIGFLWLCFSLSMILATCIPLMAYFLKTKVKNASQSSLKKSIINNTRPKSFAESCTSDDESTLGSSAQSECNDSKAIVVP